MKYLPSLIVFAFLSISSINALAQTDSIKFNYPEKSVFKKGILLPKGEGEIKVSTISFIKANHSLSAEFKQELIQFDLLDMETIKVQKGNKGLVWALIVGTITTMAIHQNVKNGYSDPSAYSIGLIGAGVGFIIGYQFKNYKTIFNDGYFIQKK